MNDERKQALTAWTNDVLDQLIEGKSQYLELESVSGDASFRRYFRASLDGESFIAVDAPPQHEDNATFVRLSTMLQQAELCAPKVYSVDYDQGFMLLVDLGDELYLPKLLAYQESENIDGANELYSEAISALVRLQSGVNKERLDPYTREKLLEEMSLFGEWFCKQLLGVIPTDKERQLINQTFEWLADTVLEQEQIAVHRDYHSRNLMILDAEKFAEFKPPGVIDFQDAVVGSYTYDLVSLLRDCYIQWPQPKVQQWAAEYLACAQSAGLFTEHTQAQLLRDMDMTGLQRNLKVLGIFSRLLIRDHKSQYLADIPLVIRYFLDVSEQYSELAEFRAWFTEKVLPAAKVKLELEN